MRVVSGEKDPVKITAALNDAARRLDTCNINGTVTGDNAAPGFLGEIIESDVPQASAASLTNSVAANVTSISLTAGDWDVSGTAYFTPAGSTTLTWIAAAISLVTSALDATNGRLATVPFGGITSAVAPSAPIMPCRFSLTAAATTIYLVAESAFGTSTLAAWGHLRARRVR